MIDAARIAELEAEAARLKKDSTTSSKPPSSDIIKPPRQALGDFPLAIASGITPENVAEYLDVADCFLVATGISRSFHHFEPPRVQALVDCVRQTS